VPAPATAQETSHKENTLEEMSVSLPRFSFRWDLNPGATPNAPYGPRRGAVLNRAGLEEARRCIAAWHGYEPTPLVVLPGLAKALRIERLWYKNEAERFGRAGIGREHAVVLYDSHSGYSAARVWWCLRYAGHDRVALLDGGFERWLAERRPAVAEPSGYPSCTFCARAEPRWLANWSDVLAALSDRRSQVLDVRSADRFRGEGAESAPRRGHMPGAFNLPYPLHWTSSSGSEAPRFLAPSALRRCYRAAGLDLRRPIITTCGSGVTASLAAFALHRAGHREVRVYDGSWAEWAANPALPVRCGPPAPANPRRRPSRPG